MNTSGSYNAVWIARMSLDDIEEDDFPDILLEQAAGIVTDLATMREMASEPAKTAQVRP